MTEKDPEMTQPVSPEPKQSPRDKKPFLQRRSSWYLIGVALAILIVAIGVFSGYRSGIRQRINNAEDQAAPKVQSQLDSARLDIDEGRYAVALTRLDWILDEMEPYLSEAELSEIGQLYSQTLLMISMSGTPTLQVSATPTQPESTPTPDLRGEEDLYNLARQQLAAQSWEETIQTLEALREKNLGYRTVQVDGMLYVALRNRGVQKILADGSLEPGIYDLTLAERFAPLDSTAEGFRTYARFYLTGASYWEVDWSQVVYYFEQVYPALPNLRDGTNMTATERFRQGAIFYASELAAAGQFCEAQEYFEKAMALGSDPEAQPTAQWAGEECWKIQHPPTEPPKPTPTPTLEAGTEEPTGEPTPDSTP